MNLPRPQGNAWLTAEDALEWVNERTGRPWRMPELLALHLPASVWLDPRGGSDALLDAMQLRGWPEGIRCPILFHGDLVRLAHESSEVTVTMTERPDGSLVRFDPPPLLPLSALRYQLRKLEERFPHSAPSGHADEAATVPALPQRKPIMQTNRERVLTALRGAGFDPLHLPAVPKGNKPCPVKAAARGGAGLSEATFDHAWRGLMKDGEIHRL